MNEPILPKEWYGKAIDIRADYEENIIVADLLDANLVGVYVELHHGDPMFIPWQRIRHIALY